MKKVLFLFIAIIPLIVRGQIITTIAGNGVHSNTGDGGLATAAEINYPVGGAFDKYGNYYFATGASGHTIRKITASGIISTVAGVTGTSGYNGDNIPATAAKLDFPVGVAVDTFCNLYIAEATNNRVRKVDVTTGIIYTIAGTGVGGYSGDSGPATMAMINNPEGICLDKYGNVYISDGSNRIRKINTIGIISTFAGTGSGGYYGDGGLAVNAQIHFPVGICFDDSENLYISDQDNARIRMVNITGTISTVAGNGTWGTIGDGGIATNAEISPGLIAIDKFGNLYIGGDAGADYRVRLVNKAGIISTVVGNGTQGFSGDNGPASNAEIDWADGLTTDSCGNLYLCDLNNYRIRKITYPHCNYLDIQETLPQNISIYPNPANNELHIDNTTTQTTYCLLSITGALMQQGALQKGNNSISIQSLPAGMYMLQVTDEAGTKTITKLVKQ